jgi:coenzyme PQQ precursor peptide PqqA
MKVWNKPQVNEQEVGLEVTSYLPAEIDIIWPDIQQLCSKRAASWPPFLPVLIKPRQSAERFLPNRGGVGVMRASVIAAALLTAFAVPALAQTTPGTAPPSGAAESGAGKPGERPPTGRVEQAVPPMKSDQPGATGAGTGEQKGMHPPTGRVEDVVPPMKPGDRPSPDQSTTK